MLNVGETKHNPNICEAFSINSSQMCVEALQQSKLHGNISFLHLYSTNTTLLKYDEIEPLENVLTK
jgi:hypothetical protein